MKTDITGVTDTSRQWVRRVDIRMRERPGTRWDVG